MTGSARAARPPILTKADSQVAVLGDGALDIKYRLTFRETESRSGITTMGPFDPGRQMLDYHVEHEGRESSITMKSKGSRNRRRGGLFGSTWQCSYWEGRDSKLAVRLAGRVQPAGEE